MHVGLSTCKYVQYKKRYPNWFSFSHTQLFVSYIYYENFDFYPCCVFVCFRNKFWFWLWLPCLYCHISLLLFWILLSYNGRRSEEDDYLVPISLILSPLELVCFVIARKQATTRTAMFLNASFSFPHQKRNNSNMCVSSLNIRK